ncbi:PQQ-binding-like beta-propeller repeat protein [Streptomyces lavendulocolor]|uniref:outer membrane protein assembly factor BamB family protein n=1 Tax=Streptomyces lavendulocolor TaxID=67316 RepID=UPI0033E9D28B
MSQPIHDAYGPPGPYDSLNPHGGGPRPPSPPRRSGGRALLAAVVALVVLGGGGAWWYAGTGGDRDGGSPAVGGSAPPSGRPLPGAGRTAPPSLDQAVADRVNAARAADEAKLLYLRRNTVDVPGTGVAVHGPWQVGDTVVTAMYRTVTAHSAADGREKWRLALDGDLCSASTRMTADRRIAVVTKDGPGKKGDCRRLRMIDLNTGRAGWETRIAKENGSDVSETYSLAFTGGTVAVGRLGASSAYRLSDGKRLFGSPPVTGCVPYAFAGGPKLVAAASCLRPGGGGREEVQELDPVTGAVRWRHPLPAGSRVQGVYSVAPLVVAVGDDAGATTGVFALTDGGARRSALAGAAGFDAHCGDPDDSELLSCRTAVDGDTLYVATAPGADGGEGNAIVAVDLTTGKTVRRIATPAKALARPLGMSGRDLLFDAAPLDDGPHLVGSVAPGATTPRVLMRAPVGRAQEEGRLSDPEPLYADGRYLLVTGRVDGFGDDQEREAATMMAFGT